MPAKFELIAPCFFGCESTAKFELTRIGAENIRVDDGRLSFAGGAEMIAAANLNLRTVERVMLLLARYRAATFDDLFDGVYDIPWEELLPADAAFPVTGSSLNSQLSSVPACQSIIKKAVVKRLMAKHHTFVLPETGAEYKIRFMLRKDQCEIMLDTTGDGLHKRGYRRNAMEAPIRETLAATIADLGRVRRAYERAVQENPALERLFVQERDQAVVQMNLSAKNYSLAAEPMSNIYGALYSTLATDDPSQRKSMRYIGSSIGRIFYLLDKAERFEMDKSSGRYNVFVVNDLRGQAAAVENARRQALAAANDLIRVYSMLDIKLNRGLLDNIMLLGLHHAVDPLEAGAEREKWEIP